MWDLIVSVPDHCLSFLLYKTALLCAHVFCWFYCAPSECISDLQSFAVMNQTM